MLEPVTCPNCGGTNPTGVISCCNALARIYAAPGPLTPGPSGQFDFAEVMAADTSGEDLPSTWRLHWLALTLAQRLETPPISVDSDPAYEALLAGVLLLACRRYGVPGGVPAEGAPQPQTYEPLMPDDRTQPPIEQLRRLALHVAALAGAPEPRINLFSGSFAIGVLRQLKNKAEQEAAREG